MEGTLMKGGIGPEDAELGVDVPDEAGVDAGVFLRADFFAIVIMWCPLGSWELSSKSWVVFQAGIFLSELRSCGLGFLLETLVCR